MRGLELSAVRLQNKNVLKAEAVEVLRQCISPTGLKASGHATGHHQVWARDSMIALLGARLAKDATIDSALRASIDVLRRKQTITGAIPNNVDASMERANFRAYADSGLWWMIGSSLMAPDRETTAAVLRWYACQDVDQSGVISMQEAADWQDLFCTRGKGLYVNCLYVWALRAAGQQERAEEVAKKINQYFWYKGDGEMLPHVAYSFSTVNVGHFDSLGRKRWLPVKKYLVNEQYYLPYLGFRAVGEWFDTLGNLLAILTDVADDERAAVILDFIDRHQMAEHPIRSLTPVIQPGDTDWRDYYAALNAAHNYHNGGIWPFIGGFYVAALVKAGRLEQARAAFARLTELNRMGEFNEWHQGETAEPLGVKAQAWSAGMYLFAAECVEREKVLPEWLGF
jgi:glycogen debranching enzyme